MAAKDKELLDAVTPFVDWEAASGKQAPASNETDSEYVDKKTLTNVINELKNQIQTSYTTQSFRMKYPDMVQYEDLVGTFLSKTDPRRRIEDRMDTAVGNVKKLLESERARGREDYEKEKKEKAAKEAEAAGLSEAKNPKGASKDSEGETFDDYMSNRYKRFAKAKGLV